MALLVGGTRQRAAHDRTQVPDHFPNQILQRGFVDLRFLFFDLCP
jgi:hypothetical protein